MRTGGLVGCAILVLGCEPEGSEPAGPFPQLELVDHEAWTISDADADPLAEHRPAQVDCPDSEWFPEGPGLEVETGACNYLAVEQPIAVDIQSGAIVSISVAHFDLMAAEPAEAHVALLLNDAVIWDDRVSIPSAAGVLDGEWAADRSYPAGTRIQFHLHNHGYNSWQLFTLTVDDR